MKSALVITLLSSLTLLPAGAEEPATGFSRDLPAKEAIALMRADKQVSKKDPLQSITVLDVRTPAEYASGHVEGAVNIDFRAPDFEKRLAALDHQKRYLVHCGNGGRSAKTRELMKKNGFAKIYHLDGGISAWKEAGGPVVVPEKK